jgi:hypothetical protein
VRPYRHSIVLGILFEAILECLALFFPSPAFNEGIQYDVVRLHFPGFLFAQLFPGLDGGVRLCVAILFMTVVWTITISGISYLVRRFAA